jgi:hypothetical protein
MDDATIRAWWSHRQGLDGRLTGQPVSAVLEQTGWARSVGGAAPYLTLFARGEIGRTAADAALAELRIHELPSARGCTYVVPASDFALALKVGQAFAGEMRTAEKLGVTAAEIDKLCAAVLGALAKAPLQPDELREATAGAVRNLGPEGAQKGLTSTLPVALEKLQSDQQRYRYALWRPNPLAGFRLSAEEAYTELARRFFTWIGPASLAEFQWFSGLGAKAAKAAVDPLKLEALGDRLILPQHREELESFQAPRRPQYALVSSLDGISHLRRDVKGLLAPEDFGRSIFGMKGSALTDLPSHAILDRGRLIGLWEYDTTTESVAWMSFAAPGSALRKAVGRAEKFVRAELGDARSFSLDSPKSRGLRLEALRKAAAH